MPPSRGRPTNRQPKSEEVSAEHKPVLEQSPKTPSTPTNPRPLSRGLHLIWTPARWVRNNPGRVGRGVWSGVFRIATLLSVGYLVFDRLYETSATIYSPASDPNNPFFYPFTVANNSHIFALYDIKWNCIYGRMITSADDVIEHGLEQNGIMKYLAPGGLINIDCKRSLQFPHQKIKEAKIFIGVSYDVNVFGIFRWHRQPEATPFFWYGIVPNPKWIKGGVE
jgi:hypothetical protein